VGLRKEAGARTKASIMTLDTAVFLFGVLVSTLVGSGLLLLFYGYAYLEEARRENLELPRGLQRLARFLGESEGG
jgi:hypothetical protein